MFLYLDALTLITLLLLYNLNKSTFVSHKTVHNIHRVMDYNKNKFKRLETTTFYSTNKHGDEQKTTKINCKLFSKEHGYTLLAHSLHIRTKMLLCNTRTDPCGMIHDRYQFYYNFPTDRQSLHYYRYHNYRFRFN